MNYTKIISEVVELTQDVAEFMIREQKNFSASDIEHKGFNDLVSYVDKESEKMIVERLSGILPEAGIIAEEGTTYERKEKFNWVIDPLDGTTNYIHGLPVFAISIALIEKDEIILGVVHHVGQNEIFTAVKGEGAYLNEKRIRISNVKELKGGLIATGFPYHNFEKLQAYLDILNEFMKSTHGIRRMGSAAIDLAYTACGRFEGFFEYNLNEWDVAAGALMIMEAGGKVTDFKGGNDFLFGKEIIAGGATHGEIVDIVQKFW